jgi:hypothetical protein
VELFGAVAILWLAYCFGALSKQSAGLAAALLILLALAAATIAFNERNEDDDL